MRSTESPSPEIRSVDYDGTFVASDSAATTTNIAAAAEEVVAAAPSPSPGKIERIVALLQSGGGVR